MTKRQLADKVLRLANKTAVAEIRRLKARLRADHNEAMELFNRYWFGGKEPWAGGGLPHEIEDFLQSVGNYYD